jgi:2-polyprenyl-6-methoxyphenol hydroxylase-like FAD-dependent oxidoreductase
MGLHWASPIFQQIIGPDMWSQIHTINVDPNVPVAAQDALLFYNGATGEQLGSGIPVQYWHRLRRDKLRNLLATGLDIRFSKRLAGISYSDSMSDGPGVTATFTDGTTLSGRILVGADGAHSTTRELLVGQSLAQVKRLPFAATFIQAQYTREQALFLRSFHPLYLASPHPNGLFAFFGLQDAPDVDLPENWTFFFYISWPSSLEQQDEEAKTFSNSDRLKQVKDLAKVYTEPWKSAFEWLDDDKEGWYMGLTVWDPETVVWDNMQGRVTLVGDAAHPMTYQRGQGLNHSITDSGKLFNAINAFAGNVDVEGRSEGAEKRLGQAEAIDAYEKEMRTRGGEEVRLSEMNTRMLHDWAKLSESPLFKRGMDANRK